MKSQTYIHILFINFCLLLLTNSQGPRIYPSIDDYANKSKAVSLRMLSYQTPSYLQAKYYTGILTVRLDSVYRHSWFAYKKSYDG